MRTRDSSGQAVIEFIVGIVAALALLAGLLQIGRLSRARTQAMDDARRDAGVQALSSFRTLTRPEFIRWWSPGPDGSRHSRDDVSSTELPVAFMDTVVARAVREPADWDRIDSVPYNALSELHASPIPVTHFGLVMDRAVARVDLLPAIRHLVYGAEAIDVECTVWMTWSDGIY